MGNSSLKLKSNIALKSKYEDNPYGYLPYDLLPSPYNDKRMFNALTPYQQEQQTKSLFQAKHIVDENGNVIK